MTQYAAQNGMDDTDKLIAYAHALATRYGEAAAALACQMYDQTAAAAGAAVPPAEPADTATYGETAAAILGTLKQSTLPQSVGNSTGRLVKQAASDTTLKNAKRDHAEFAWIPSGDGCPYCMMIASNGWRPASKATANGGHADHIHPNCQCEFAIRFSRDDGVAGYDPDKYKRIFDDADGNTWREKIRSLDRERYVENADAINARRRELYAESRATITGGRITNPDDEKAVEWAKSYYEEIRHKGTDCQHIAERINVKQSDVEEVKDYIFYSGTWYNELTGKEEPFAPDAAIAQSWQRLAEGNIKDIKPHDRTLIKHELLEKRIKAENPGISHIQAHEMAQKKYNYQKEAGDYYASLSEHKKKG